MAVSIDGGAGLRFGAFVANVRTGELRREGVKIALQEQPFQVLAVLLQHPGELVTREELRHRVWPENTFVEFDYALNTAIKKIRAALGDYAAAPQYVETIPRRGYRFIAPVNHPTEGAPTPHITDSVSGETVSSRQPEPQHHALSLLLPGVLLLGVAVGYLIRGRD
jgi:DNA-binding winged helix-turn-helix (wHTH) protein